MPSERPHRDRRRPITQGRAAGGPILRGNLTVEDARHILRCEGGELTPAMLANRAASLAVGLGLTAWAIHRGDATVWHLTLPMVGQYAALLVALPVLYAALGHPGLRKDAVGGLVLGAAVAAGVSVAVAFRALGNGVGWAAQLADDGHAAWRWVTDAKMHWPLFWAVADTWAGLPHRVRNLYAFGPPFYGVGLGCAMRLVVPLLGCFLVPLVASAVDHDPRWWPWIVWAVIAAAEALALWVHWDIGARLRERDNAAQ